MQTFSDLHAKYGEGVYWTRDLATNLIRTPNIVVHNQQATYGHFADAVVFSSDHLTIQARGHADGSITSAEMASNFPPRSFCIETRYKVPATDTEVTVPARAIAAEAATRTRRDVLRTSPRSTLPNCSAAHAIGSIMRATERCDGATEGTMCTTQRSDRRRPVAPS